MIERRQFRIPEAAALLSVSKDLLEGWHDRGLIQDSGRDTSAPGHPYLISYAELIRLGVMVELQSLFREQLATRWNPGPFLADFRETVSDSDLVHEPAATPPLSEIIRGNAEKNVRKVAGCMVEDRILVLFYGRASGEVYVMPLISLQQFKDSLDNSFVFTTCWLTLNVSSVVRGIRSRE